MTWEQFKQGGIAVEDWRSADELMYRRMEDWGDGIMNLLKFYLERVDIPIRTGRVDRERMTADILERFFTGEVKSGSGAFTSRYYTASHFFEEGCGMRWGGAVLRKIHHKLITGGDAYGFACKLVDGQMEEAMEYVRFKSFDVVIAEMTVWKDGKMLQLPVWSGRIMPEGFECPDTASDIELCSNYLEKRTGNRGRTYYLPIMTGYMNSREHCFDEGEVISWDVLERETRQFLNAVDYNLRVKSGALLNRTLADMRDDYGCPMYKFLDFNKAEETREAMEGNWAQ